MIELYRIVSELNRAIVLDLISLYQRKKRVVMFELIWSYVYMYMLIWLH